MSHRRPIPKLFHIKQPSIQLSSDLSENFENEYLNFIQQITNRVQNNFIIDQNIDFFCIALNDKLKPYDIQINIDNGVINIINSGGNNEK